MFVFFVFRLVRGEIVRMGIYNCIFVFRVLRCFFLKMRLKVLVIGLFGFGCDFLVKGLSRGGWVFF